MYTLYKMNKVCFAFGTGAKRRANGVVLPKLGQEEPL